MTRFDATRRLRAHVTREAVIASLGHPAYDLFVAGDRPENFYTWGSMGLASSIGLGLAMAQPDRRVIVLDGDGSILMNVGSLATIGMVKPSNLTVIVWDNEEYATTGGQPTATAGGADLARVGAALGIAGSVMVRTPEAFDAAVLRALDTPGPWLIVAKVQESAPAGRPPLDCVTLKARFMKAMGA